MGINDDKISMVGECTDSYFFEERPDGSAEITIKVPARFRLLWMCRLSELRTDMNEICEYERLARERQK